MSFPPPIYRLCVLAVLDVATPAAAAEPIDFARDVRPILSKRCVRCHGPKKQEGGLRLDVRRRARVGGDTGPAFVPGTAHGEVLKRIAARDEKDRMPPDDDPLPAKEIATLRAWVEQGANVARRARGQGAGRGALGVPAGPAADGARGRRPPTASGTRSIAFVLARLEAKGLDLSPEADRRTLVRRLHLDLIGLPPTPDGGGRVRRRHARPAPTRRLVDRLLASPHFGERWGRHWLDLARFAESDGYENDSLRPDAWRFRDWVIEAVNDDLPFDQFTVEQLAGDLLPGATARAEDRGRVPPQHALEQRRLGGQGGVPHPRRQGPHRHDRPRLDGPDARLRPVPLAQVRPGRAARVLPALRLLQPHRQRRRARSPTARRGRDAEGGGPRDRASTCAATSSGRAPSREPGTPGVPAAAEAARADGRPARPGPLARRSGATR